MGRRAGMAARQPRWGTVLTNLTNSNTAAYDRRMGKVVNLYEAKSQLSALVERAAQGEEIVIAKAGVPRARLVPVKPRIRRRPGRYKGRIWVAQDFDAPLPQDVLDAFAGTPDEADLWRITRPKRRKR